MKYIAIAQILLVGCLFLALPNCSKSEGGGGDAPAEATGGDQSSGGDIKTVASAACGIALFIDNTDWIPLDPLQPIFTPTDADIQDLVDRCVQAQTYIASASPASSYCKGSAAGKPFEVRAVVRRSFADGYFETVHRSSKFSNCNP